MMQVDTLVLAEAVFTEERQVLLLPSSHPSQPTLVPKNKEKNNIQSNVFERSPKLKTRGADTEKNRSQGAEADNHLTKKTL